VTRLIALLRGINVGGNKRMAMADLRALLTALGYRDVETLLQSGNAVLTADGADPADVAADIESAIERQLGMAVSVIVRTGDDLRDVIARNPLPDAVTEPVKLHVAFLSARPDAGRFEAVDQERFAPDAIRLGERALYIWYRDGAGRSKLTNDVIERALGVRATSRNWNTVTKMADLAAR
jgi:uncharacterized protein (DUF1697 family)